MDLAGSNAFITGGGSGIGRATAIGLAAAGARHVHILDVVESGARETAALVADAGAGATVHVVDVAQHQDLAAAFEVASRAGPLDIVFNNAGIVTGAHLFPDTPVERIQRIIAVNITAVVVGTQLAVAHMANRGGVVVNTASTTALHTRFRDYLYSMTKTAILSFTGSCAPLVESHKVRVTAVIPSLVATPILDTTGGDRRADWMEPVLADNFALEPEDVAAAVLQLIRDDHNAGGHVVVDEEWLKMNPRAHS